MTDAVLGVGIVGCGAIGARRAAVAAGDPRCRIVIAADRDAVRANEVARATGAVPTTEWKDVVDHPDVGVVVVATTHDWLSPVSVAALEAGKHVLCEKPMSRNSREATDLVAAARRSATIALRTSWRAKNRSPPRTR